MNGERAEFPGIGETDARDAGKSLWSRCCTATHGTILILEYLPGDRAGDGAHERVETVSPAVEAV
jgi:hypothetical protein